jgi:Na+/H+ antiporter NhaC
MVLSRRPATEIEPSRRHRLPLALLLAACLLSATGFGGGASQTSQVVAAEPAAAGVVTAEPQAMTPDATPGAYYGAWVLIPPVVTIVLAIVLRQVLPALTVGILIAAYMLAWCAAPGAWADVLVGGVRRALEEFLVGALSDGGHVRIILFTLFIGGMVGVIGANGGTAAIVNAVARWASNRRRGQVSTWLAGLLVFFDDYANAMIIGPAMRPVCDRLRISRAKLAYLVDSTAAPVSSIALIGTWIGAEVGFIHSGLVGLEQVPPFLSGFELDEGFAYGAFLKSIPYRFYPILALVMVFLIGWLDRDFGPMRSAERAAATATPETDGAGAAASRPGRAWHAGVPVGILVVATLALLVLTGWSAIHATDPDCCGFELVQRIISASDSTNSILYGALAALLAALLITLATRTLPLAQTIEAATDVMSRMLPTLMVLVLAWALSDAMQQLQLGQVAQVLLQSANFDATWLPLLIFVAACVVSFATGTSWGTMGILCPAAVTIAAGLLTDAPADQALPLFYASIGAVLAGAVFGDHCSPISDTTVLSSLASECSLGAHVWTQMPYALTVGAVSILCGDVLCRATGQPWWVGLLAGVAALVLIVLLFGRRPAPLPANADYK